MSQRENVTLFMLLLAAFQVLLARYSGQRDIAVGTPIANRTHKEVEGLIGFFVNTLVVRTQVQGEERFVEVLRQVRERALGAYTHQDVPFEHLVGILRPERDLSRSPLFQVLFVLQSPIAAPGSEASEEKEARSAELVSQHVVVTAQTTAKFDLTFNVISGRSGPPLLPGV